MKHSLNSNSLRAYMFCPYYYSNFNKHLEAPVDGVSSAFSNDIRNMFIKHMQFGYIPTQQQLAISWRKSSSAYRAEGFSVNKNAIFINTKNALLEYTEIFKDISIVGADFYLPVELYEGSYTGLVDFILLNNTTNKIIPVFFEEDRNYLYPISLFTYINLYTFINIFGDKGFKVQEYYIVKISKKMTTASFSRIAIDDKLLENAEKYLKNIIRSIGLSLIYPNTNSCKNCEFNDRCKPWK